MAVVAFRAAAYSTPMWALPNPVAGRYNAADEAATTYLSLHPLTPWAERLRAEAIDDPYLAAQMRLPIWAARLKLDDEMIVRLTFDTADDFGLAPEDLVGDDYGPCQALGRSLRAEPTGPQAIIAPSAALPGTDNLVLLGGRVASPFLLDPIDDVDVPVSVTAVAGRAPAPLVELVHHRYSAVEHPGLAAWRAGEPYQLREPEFAAADLVPAL
jgi:hypothetical protein